MHLVLYQWPMTGSCPALMPIRDPLCCSPLVQEEPDFVRLAVKCRALIVPFAAVGADDAYDILLVRTRGV